MNDSRISRYLSAQADLIPLTPADPEGVVRRGRRRRAQRRAGLLGAVAVLATVATSVAVYDSGDQSSETGVASVVASPFDWSTVTPEVGLGFGRETVALSNGTVYSLSTAPGPMVGQRSFEPHLYRSDDGTEWQEVTMPTGMATSSLGAQGDTLYALGTAPAGGSSREVVLAASTDGAGSWTNLPLPSDIAELEQRFPEQVMLGELSVAAKDATHQVVTATISAQIDPTQLIPDFPEGASWEITPGGVRLFAPTEDEECLVDAPEGAHVRSAGGMVDPSGEAPRGAELGSYTWGQLGVHPDLQELINGRTLVYLTEDGVSFEQVQVPGSPRGWSGRPVVSDDGYRLFVGDAARQDPVTQVFSSTDGRTWTPRGELPGGVTSAGVLDGKAAVAVTSFNGATTVYVEADDSWRPLDLRQALGDTGDDDVWFNEVTFGPLGVAGTASVSDRGDGRPQGTFIVHSRDGQSVSAVDVSEELGVPFVGQVFGTTVTADAVVVRVGTFGDGNPSTVEPVTLLVGTPR